MTVFFRILVVIALMVGLSACTENVVPSATTNLEEGTKLTIKASNEEYYITIGTNTDGLITSEATNWKNEFLYKNQYYRGFLLHSRDEDDYHWKLDIDLKQVDALFPMEVGDATEIKGSIINLKDDKRTSYRAEISIIGEKAITLPSGTYTAYQVKLSQYYESEKGIKAWHQTVYHCPELQVNLKGTYNSHGEEKYWRIVKIEHLDADLPPTSPARPRRRNGTVMI